MAQLSQPSPQDIFLYDTEQLHAIANDSIISKALAWFKENRVHDIDRSETELWGSIEDETEEDLFCRLTYSDEGCLNVSCDCESLESPVCTHAVALLYAYASELDSDELLGAVEGAIALRAKRGRNEVKVKHLSGEPWFGTWKALSINSSLAFPRSYRVNIRSLQQRNNYCDCQDFAINQLGTCKHIESVLHTISKRDDYTTIKIQAAPYSYVYLSWEVQNPPQVMLHRAINDSAELAPLLDHYFDANGLFKLTMPDDFFRFISQVRDRGDINLGEDALAYAQRLAAKASQLLHSQNIKEQLESSGGHLPGLRATLYPYQTEGVAFLAANGRALLADDMGLGKTIQAIAAAQWMTQHSDVKRMLVVCPASLKHQWAREIKKFTDISVQIIQGTPEARSVQYRRGDGFYIINYELVLRDLSIINEVLTPDLLILDEAQRIKNWRTKIATTIKQIPSHYAFVLSGTPLENRLEDLFSLMQVVDSNLLGPLWRYMVDFHITDDRNKVLGYRNLSALRRRLSPVMLRRDRRLVSDQLPNRIEQRIDVQLTEKQQELHDDALAIAGRLAHTAKRRPLTPVEQNIMMASLQRARMACNAAGLVDKETEGSPKLDEMENLIDELCIQSGLKAVIFSQWALMTEMVEARLRKMGVGCVRLHGGIPTSRRGDLIDSFMQDDAIQVFISTDAGGVGLNLQQASVVINLDMPWNPAILDQRIARVHRLGQRETVQSILIVSADSYEQHVASLVKGKRHLFDNVIDPDATEDVVGVSKKLLETLVEDLASFAPEQDQKSSVVVADEAPENASELPVAEATTQPSMPHKQELEENLRISIEKIQTSFGQQIERILGAGGGLLVVLEAVSPDAEQMAEDISSHQIPVALIDLRTLGSLQRLGNASPVSVEETYFDRQTDAPIPHQETCLTVKAKEKLEAAEILLGQGLVSTASDLLTSSLLHAAASKAKIEHVPSQEEIGIWMYAEAIPNGWLDQDQVNLITRGISILQAPSIPEPMLEALLTDIRVFLDVT